jgi:hypothetical protein
MAKKLAGNILLTEAEDVNRRSAALLEALEDAALAPHDRHNHGQLEGCLREPGHCGGAIAVAAAGGEDSHAVREQPQHRLPDCCVHLQSTSMPG